MSAKLQGLTEYLIGLDFIPRENIDSWVDVCTVIPASVNMGQYFELCRLHHRCTLFIERYTGDSRLITAWLAAWIKDHDGDRDDDRLPDPDVDIEALDASGTQWDIDVSIEFVEPVLIEPDEATGNIDWNGQKWRLIDEPIIDTAEEVDRVEPEDKPPLNGQNRKVGALS